MRFQFFRVIVALLGTAALSGTASAATQYHLMCRGSPDTQVIVTSSIESPGKMNISLQINKYRGTKASVKTDGSHLAPGECSWSTNVIASVYYSLVYYLAPASDLRIFINAYGGPNDNRTWGSVAYAPETTDANLLWLGNISDGVEDPTKGTLFDPDIVYHLYVAIQTNTFILKRAYPTAYPY